MSPSTVGYVPRENCSFDVVNSCGVSNGNLEGNPSLIQYATCTTREEDIVGIHCFADRKQENPVMVTPNYNVISGKFSCTCMVLKLKPDGIVNFRYVMYKQHCPK